MNNIISLTSKLYDEIRPQVMHEDELCEDCLMNHIIAYHLMFQKLAKEMFITDDDIQQFFEGIREVANMFEEFPLEARNYQAQLLSVN